MKELLQACLNKEPQNVHAYTPTPSSLAIQLQYKNGMIVELVEESGGIFLKAVEVSTTPQGQQSVKLKARLDVTHDDEMLDLVEQVKEKYFSQQDQMAVCEHWALMINGKKNGLEVTKK